MIYNHILNIGFAVKYGMAASAIVGQLYYWCSKNKEKNKHLHDGRYWTFLSIKEFTKYLPYLNERKIKYCLDKLKKEELLLTANYNKNPLDKTTWYTLSDKAISILQNCLPDSTKLSLRLDNIVPSATIKTNNIPKEIKERKYIKERKAPTLKEIESFIKERNSPVDAQRFYDYYSVNKWKDKHGVCILSNWKQRVISWEKDEKRPLKEKVELTENEKKFYGERNGIF